MQVSKKLKNFLKDPDIQALIDKGKFDEVYTKLGNYEDDIKELTQLLLIADIDVFKYISVLPRRIFKQTSLSRFEVSNNIKVIGPGAFSECFYLKQVTIPEGVERIEELAFRNCQSLREIELPDSINYIGYSAFGDCESLWNIKLPNRLQVIPNRMLGGCKSLRSLTIPDSVTEIGSSAFLLCTSLKNLILSANLSEIGDSVLLWTSKKMNIVYNNTIEKWKAIKIDPNNKDLFSHIISCTNGKLRYSTKVKRWVKN